jgi:hypothetical protein
MSYGGADPQKQYMVSYPQSSLFQYKANQCKSQLSHGLRFLSKLNSLNTYGERRQLLDSRGGLAGNMLPEELYFTSPNNSPGIKLKTYGHQALEDLTRPDNIDDLDSGPFQTWFWIHEELDSELFIMSILNTSLRRCGYVMWDQPRAMALKEKLMEAQKSGDSIQMHSEEEWAKMEESFGKRSLIWQQGGRGYWVDGDLSGISWLEGQPSTTYCNIKADKVPAG